MGNFYLFQHLFLLCLSTQLHLTYSSTLTLIANSSAESIEQTDQDEKFEYKPEDSTRYTVITLKREFGYGSNNLLILCASISESPDLIESEGGDDSSLTVDAQFVDMQSYKLNKSTSQLFLSSSQLSKSDSLKISVFISKQKKMKEEYSISVATSNIFSCPSNDTLNPCSGNGTCASHGVCECKSGFTANDCSIEIYLMEFNEASSIALAPNVAKYALVKVSKSYFASEKTLLEVELWFDSYVSISKSQEIEIYLISRSTGSNSLPCELENLQEESFDEDDDYSSEHHGSGISKKEVHFEKSDLFFQNSGETIELVISFINEVDSDDSTSIDISVLVKSNGDDHEGNATSVAIAIFCGCFGFVLVFLLGVYLYRRWKRQKCETKKYNEADSSHTSEVHPQNQVVLEINPRRMASITKQHEATLNKDDINTVMPIQKYQDIFREKKNNLDKKLEGITTDGKPSNSLITEQHKQKEIELTKIIKIAPKSDSKTEITIKQDEEKIEKLEMSQRDKKELQSNNINYQDNCSVCLIDFLSDDDVRVSICGHIFHSECLVEWLQAHENCPVCRQDHSKNNLDKKLVEWKTQQRQVSRKQSISEDNIQKESQVRNCAVEENNLKIDYPIKGDESFMKGNQSIGMKNESILQESFSPENDMTSNSSQLGILVRFEKMGLSEKVQKGNYVTTKDFTYSKKVENQVGFLKDVEVDNEKGRVIELSDSLESNDINQNQIDSTKSKVKQSLSKANNVKTILQLESTTFPKPESQQFYPPFLSQRNNNGFSTKKSQGQRVKINQKDEEDAEIKPVKKI